VDKLVEDMQVSREPELRLRLVESLKLVEDMQVSREPELRLCSGSLLSWWRTCRRVLAPCKRLLKS
jgi:hypothetical protein